MSFVSPYSTTCPGWPSSDKKKYLILGEGKGTIGEETISSISNHEVNETLTFTATEDSIIMEIEI